MNLNQETLKMFVRHGITTFGGALVSKGWIETSELEMLAGAGALLVSLGWSWYRKWSRAKTEEVK